MTVAGSVHRFLLADEIATSLMTGRSVVLTHAEPVADVLALVIDALIEAAVQVLSLPSSANGTPFLQQFAKEWRTAGAGKEEPDSIPSRGSGKRFVLVINQAQKLPAETFQQLESMAQAWPGMQMLLAGSPGIAGRVHGDGQQLIPCRTWITVTASVAETAIQASFSDDQVLETVLSKRAVQPTDLPTASVDESAILPALAEPVQVSASRHPLRRVTPTWTTFLAVTSLLAFVAVPKIPLDPQKALRSVRWVSPSVGVNEATPGRSGDARTTPALAEIAQTGLPEGSTRSQVPKLDQVTLSQVAEALRAPRNDNHQDKQSVPITETPVGSTVIDLTVPAAPPVPQPTPVTASEPVNAATPGSLALGGQAIQVRRELPPVLVPSMAASMVDAMTRRGLAMLDFGDVSAARLLLARAAHAGSGAAAYAMGTTFDAKTLERLGAVGITPDQAAATAWYRLALKLGDDRARIMLGEPSTSVAESKGGAAQ